jgi:hypothetical protein
MYDTEDCCKEGAHGGTMGSPVHWEKPPAAAPGASIPQMKRLATFDDGPGNLALRPSHASGFSDALCGAHLAEPGVWPVQGCFTIGGSARRVK